MYGYVPPAPQATIQPVGQWLMANNYHDIFNAPIPMDGSRTLYMLANEPKFYVVTMVNGQRMIQDYTFEAIAPQEPPASPEDRLTTLEENMARIISLLEGVQGGNKNESNIPANAEVTKSKH